MLPDCCCCSALLMASPAAGCCLNLVWEHHLAHHLQQGTGHAQTQKPVSMVASRFEDLPPSTDTVPRPTQCV